VYVKLNVLTSDLNFDSFAPSRDFKIMSLISSLGSLFRFLKNGSPKAQQQTDSPADKKETQHSLEKTRLEFELAAAKSLSAHEKLTRELQGYRSVFRIAIAFFGIGGLVGLWKAGFVDPIIRG
jgi:hypothetical protein